MCLVAWDKFFILQVYWTNISHRNIFKYAHSTGKSVLFDLENKFHLDITIIYNSIHFTWEKTCMIIILSIPQSFIKYMKQVSASFGGTGPSVCNNHFLLFWNLCQK